MKVPPFGKQLNSDAREVWLYFGSDPWHAAKYRAARKLPVLLLPPDKQPEQFRWPVAGKKVLMIQQGQHDVSKIPSFASVLFRAGAIAVCAIYGDGQVVFYTRKADAKVA